jgi:hypothetical protein
MGFGQWMEGARKTLYGSERILDADRSTTREFLVSMGLDYGVKVRCYVEGETELGALTSAVGEAGSIEFVNLRGQFVEKRGKGLNFVESVRNDAKSHVFSVVLLDNDRGNHVRAIKRAASAGDFFGEFFIAIPDFEFANFSIRELCEIAADGMTGVDGRQWNGVNRLMDATRGAESGGEFFRLLREAGVSEIAKSELWGICLMRYASKHQTCPPEHPAAGKTRPVVEAARLLIQARRAGYLASLTGHRLNPETGRLVRK